MANGQDYYSILGVSKDAGEAEIKSAFRTKAKQYHPDMNKGDKAAEAEEQFKKVNEAYSVLSDPQKRKTYDSVGHDAFSRAASSGGNATDFGGFGGFGGFGDLFDTLFGGMGFGSQSRQPSNGPQRGRSLRYDLTIELEDAYQGATRQISVGHNEACNTCKGTGAKPGTPVDTCPRCNGTGQVQNVQQSAFGRFVNVQTCPECNGSGEKIQQPCTDCNGKGYVFKQRKINVKLPAGVDDGQIITLNGQGDAGIHGGPAGNVQIVVHVRENRIYSRRGADLFMELQVPYAQAALGGDIVVPTMEDSVKYSLPECTQPGTVFRLRNKGMPRSRSGQGDLFVTVNIGMPKKLTEEQKQLLRRLNELESGNQPSQADERHGERGGSDGLFGRLFHKDKDRVADEK